MVPILKLKQFQELWHKIVFLIGDATAQVGDASDKDAERPMLSRAETESNAKAFLTKFEKVLDLSKIDIYFNSEGLDKVNFAGVGELAKNFSVAEMLDRDNFSKRYKGGVRISLQEFLYPIMQGYDSVAIAKKYGACDVELGGNDQYFNLLAGRRLMEAHGLPKQDIMTFELLIGSDGKKMSKTSPNTIAIDEAPQSMYQKLINVRDDLIVTYYELATDATLEEIEAIKKRLESGEHPNTLKIELAQRIITMYHGKPYNPEDKENIEKVSLRNYLLASLTNKVKESWKPFSWFFKYNLWYVFNWDDQRAIYIMESIFTSKEVQYFNDIPTIVTTINDALPNFSKEIKESLEEIVYLFKFWYTLSISDLLKTLGFCATSGDVRNALAGNSIRVDGTVITDPKFLVTISPNGTLIEMGKKKAKRVFL